MASGIPRRSAAAAAAAAAAIARASRGSAQSPVAAAPAPPTAVAAVPSRAAASTRPHATSAPTARSSSGGPSPSSPADRGGRGHTAREHVVRLLTFNVWFEPVAMRARMRAIGAHIERLRPAVIGFQEVTRESLALLKAQRWARYYDCSADTAPPFSEAYFVVLFSALPVASLETLPFANTGMGRELLAARVQVAPRCSLLVATAHLESLPQFARTRVSQLQQSLAFLEDRVGKEEHEVCLGAVLMGDTNLLRGDMKLLDPRAAAEELTVEQAKSGRAACRACSGKIDKGAHRVGRTAKDTLASCKTVEITLWYHKECFLGDAKTSEAEKRVVRQAIVAEATPGERGENDSGDPGAATRGLPRHWRDLWLAVPGNSEQNGFTYDGKRNALIKNKAYQSRLDRVYFYAPTRATREAFEAIEMVGTEPLTGEGTLWASDHFGLLTTFSFDAAIAEGGHAGVSDAKRKRDDSDREDESEREQDDEDKEEDKAPPKRRPSGSKHAPIELE